MINRQTIIRTLLTALLAFTAGQGSADDTEIYVGDAQTANGVILPNVLLILDTSSSMVNNTDDTDPAVDRLERMKEALKVIINSVSNVKIGLMRFHREGGPVLYPVSDISQAATDVDDQGGVIDVSIATSADDAEESDVGTMTLDNTQLYLLDRVDTSSAGSIEVRINDDNDSLEERVNGNNMRYDSTDLEMMKDGSHLQIIGLRFQDIPVPADAQVTDATIEFEIDDREDEADDDLTVTIHGETTAGAIGFDDNNDSYKVSDRAKTFASVDWAIPAYLAVDEKFTIANPLNDIIEEVITTANGWDKDNDNKNDIVLSSNIAVVAE